MMDIRMQDLLASAEDALRVGVDPERVAMALRRARVAGDLGAATDQLDEARVMLR